MTEYNTGYENDNTTYLKIYNNPKPEENTYVTMEGIRSPNIKYIKEFETILPFMCYKDNYSKMCKFIYSNVVAAPSPIYEDPDALQQTTVQQTNGDVLNLRNQAAIKSTRYQLVKTFYIEKRKQGKSICQSFKELDEEYSKVSNNKITGGKNTKKNKRSKKSKRSKKNKKSVRK